MGGKREAREGENRVCFKGPNYFCLELYQGGI